MPRETRSSGSTGVGEARPSVGNAPKGVFRKDVEYWTIGYGGKSFRLKETIGLGYLAHLVRHPGVEFHVLDLAEGIASQRDNDDAGQAQPRSSSGDEDREKAGTDRRSASASERARQRISKTLKLVLDKIEQNDATLGDFFSRCIKTGYFCSYRPDPDSRSHGNSERQFQFQT